MSNFCESYYNQKFELPIIVDKQPMTVIIYDSSTLGYAQYLEEPLKEYVKKINTALGFNKLIITFTTKKPTKLNDNEFIIYYGTNSDVSGKTFPEAINFIYSLCGFKRSGYYYGNNMIAYQVFYDDNKYYKIHISKYNFLGGIMAINTYNAPPTMLHVYWNFLRLLRIIGFEQDRENLYDFDTMFGDNCYNNSTNELNVQFSNFDIIIMRPIVVAKMPFDLDIAKELRADLDTAIQYTEHQLDRQTRESYEGK